MRIKRFTGKDLPSVVNQIKLEFGLKAIILSERQKPEGLIEVTAGVRDEDLAPLSEPGPGPEPSPELGPNGQPNGHDQDPQKGPPESDFDQALERESQNPHPELSALRAKAGPKAKGRGRPLRPGPSAPEAPLEPEPKIVKAPKTPALPAAQVAPALGAAAYRKAQTAPVLLDHLSSELSLERQILALREFVSEELGELKNLFWDLAHRQSLTEKWRDRPDVVGLYRFLLATGLNAKWSRELAEKSAESKDAWGGDLYEHLRKTLKPRLRCLSPEAPLPRLMALTGPTGSGKTTSLVRLAAWF
ncbi:MAG: hypothetical protein LBE80_01700, partial [Deltaproteobacteria bacterium]|nr:hypothetical protein [Deltaproteobacteria bacterium]